MTSTFPFRTRSLLVLGAVAFALASITGPGALAASTSKPYAVTVTPHDPGAGTTTTYTATLTNETGSQMLGSANVTAPSSFSVTGAHDLSGGTFSVSGNTILLRNLNLSPGGTASVQIDAQAPCHVSTYFWTSVAKQSNNFSGPPGNNLFLDALNSDLSTTLTGTCTLSFQAQPMSTQFNTNITNSINDPAGPPVQVAVHDAGGATITTGPDSASPVSLAIQTNPAPGSILTVGPSTRSGGVTSFPSLSIDLSELGYTLRASTTNPDVQSGDSVSFDIFDVGKKCLAGPCSGTFTKGTTTAEVNAAAGAIGDLLSLGIGLEPLDCPGYDESSAVVTFAVTGRTKTVTITLDKLAVTHSINSYQVCYASPNAFVDRNGFLTNGPALLPDCADAAAPCVVSRKIVSGDARVILSAPLGDPKGRV
jgi:hypothetical protein